MFFSVFLVQNLKMAYLAISFSIYIFYSKKIDYTAEKVKKKKKKLYKTS